MHERRETVERFRERLLVVIERSGLSRSAFAREAGIDRSTLSQILAPHGDRLPRVETLAAIAVRAHVSLDWLVGLSEGEGPLTAEVHQDLVIEPGAGSPMDERLERWYAEAAGYKIRHVPAMLPDQLLLSEVIDYMYGKAVVTPEQRRETTQAALDYVRRPETDTEVCCPLQSLTEFARGEGVWVGLSEAARRRQLTHMRSLLDELYPTFRLFLFDGLERYSVPFTLFGPLRAAVYMGQMYFVLNSREHIRVLTEHFDDLIRAARVQPVEVGELVGQLLAGL